MSAMRNPLLSAAEYLEIERRAEYKSEFYAGRMIARAGASKEHNLITLNVGSALHAQLRSGPCQTYANDMRVLVDATGRYTYPDIVVVCEAPRFEDEAVDTLLNPTFIVEVLSPSTESYDRGVKSIDYRLLPSLQEYLLIAQDRPHVERYRRGQDAEWILTEADGLEATLPLTAIGCELRLAEVYERVTFPVHRVHDATD